MFFCRLTQERQTKIITQLAAQMSEALKREDDRFARDVAKKEAEYQKKCKEKEAKEKAAIESIAEYRTTVVRNLRLFSFLFTPAEEPGPDRSWWLWCQASACCSRPADTFSWGPLSHFPVRCTSARAAENPAPGHWAATMTVLITALIQGCFCPKRWLPN